MKNHCFFLLLCAAIPAVPVQAQLQSRKIMDPWIDTKITLPTGSKALGEMLVLYSKAASANIFADVTHTPLTSSINSPADEKFIVGLTRLMGIRSITNQADMTYDFGTSDSFILWPRPNLERVANLILNEEQQFTLANGEYPVTSRPETLASLQQYFAQEKGWNPKSDTVANKNQSALGVKEPIPLKDFPSSLRKALLVEMVRQIRLCGFINGSCEPRAWTNDFGKDVRVQLYLPSKSRKLPIIELHVKSQTGSAVPFIVGVPQQIKVADNGTLQFASDITPWLLATAKTCGVDETTPAAPPEGVTTPETVKTDTASFSHEFAFDPLQIAELQKTVTLNQQSASPADTLKSLQQQSDVVLKCPELTADTKIMALANNIPLEDVMSSLARLYNSRWEKQEKDYVLVSYKEAELPSLLHQMGLYARYPLYVHPPTTFDVIETQVGDELATEVVDTGDKKLLDPGGVGFLELPDDLQKDIITYYREQNIGNLIVSQQHIENALSQDIEIRFAPKPTRPPQFFGGDGTTGSELNGSGSNAILAAYTSDGRFITQLFPQFYVAKATKSDEVMEEFQRQRDANMDKMRRQRQGNQ